MGMYGEFVLVEVDSTVGKLAEGSLLLDLGSLDGVLRGKDVSIDRIELEHREAAEG